VFVFRTECCSDSQRNGVRLHSGIAFVFDRIPQPLTSFITPDGKLYFGAGYLPSEHKGDKSSFREAADEALARYAEQSKIDEESFQLEVER
jgi:hypothetical protein